MNRETFKTLLIESSQSDLNQRKEIEKKLSREATEHLDSLAELIADENVAVRRVTVEILRRIGTNSDAQELLAQRLGIEPDVKTRRRIAAAIGDSEQREMSGALLQQLDREEHRFVQASLILALGKLGFRDWPQQWLDFANREGPVAEAVRKATRSSAADAKNLLELSNGLKNRPAGTFLLQHYAGLEPLAKIELRLSNATLARSEAEGWLVLPNLTDDSLAFLQNLKTIIADYHLALSVAAASASDLQTVIARATAKMRRVAPYLQERCVFRLSLPLMETRESYRKLVVSMSRHIEENTGWINNPSDYDVDLRIIKLGAKNAVIWRDRRWASSRQALSRVAAPASIHPSVAAALCFAATAQELPNLVKSRGAGKVLLDPCCGAGTILSEWLTIFPRADAFGYDISEKAIQLSRQNLEPFKARHKVDVADMRDIPLPASSVDFIVCNLPFGIRSKHEVSNRRLYARFMSEALRVLRPRGTLVTYTADRRAIESAFESRGWNKVKPLTRVKAGGLDVAIHRVQKPEYLHER